MTRTGIATEGWPKTFLIHALINVFLFVHRKAQVQKLEDLSSLMRNDIDTLLEGMQGALGEF